LECKGLCHESCHKDVIPATATPREIERIGEHAGDLIPASDCDACPLLTAAGRCRAYEVRPLLCRLWGMVADPLMICPHCRPDRYLTNEEVMRIWEKLEEINRRYLATL
jgi:Fe-S-cluster containining protein